MSNPGARTLDFWNTQGLADHETARYNEQQQQEMQVPRAELVSRLWSVNRSGKSVAVCA